MHRLYIPVPTESDFPKTVVVQTIGKGFEKEYVELQANNVMLQELILDIATMLGKNVNLRDLCEENVNLRDENAKLRKLLLDIWNDAIRFDDFWDYVMDDGELYNENELPHYQERMHKLGVEVN